MIKRNKKYFFYFLSLCLLIVSAGIWAFGEKFNWKKTQAGRSESDNSDQSITSLLDQSGQSITEPLVLGESNQNDFGIEQSEISQNSIQQEDLENVQLPASSASTKKTATPTKKSEFETGKDKDDKEEYPVHKDIRTTFFWIGEEASNDNGKIPNAASAWDDDWQKHFGGVDDPEKRKDYFPSKFKPKENPFYFALPYNDFDEDGKRKESASKLPWADEKKYGKNESLCKNRWIKIINGKKIAYAQWEDVGPFEEDDNEYVFGDDKPKNKENDRAGLDVSPAVKDYLDLDDVDKVDWQFINESEVPDGPWKKVITKSDVNWD